MNMKIQFANRMGNLQASVIREILKFTADPSVISFAAGNPAPEAFPVEAISQISADILKNNPIGALQYSISEGYTPLRENIKKVMLSQEEIVKEYDDLIVVSGAQQGIELSCKVLCNPGDTIICENPSFIGSLNAFKSYEVDLVGVEIEEGGISLTALEQALQQHQHVKFIYLIPNFQNPSGTTMSLEKRKAVLQLAEQYDVMIVEDNPYGELRFAGEHIPSIKSLDTTGRVIYCGSFSKVLSPGLRVGFVVAVKEFLQKIVVCKQCSDVHSNIFAQMICNEFLQTCDYRQHIAKLKEIYRHKCGLMLSEIEKQFHNKITYTRPEGGLFIWCTLPEGVDMMSFCSTAVQNKVAVVPGSAFLPSDDYQTQSFRLNYSTPTDENIIKGIEILGQLSHTL